MRIRRTLLAGIRQLAALSGTLPHPAADGGISPAVVEVLHAKLDGAQTAARLLGPRRNEERQRFQAELDREREELTEHLQFLQTQLEGTREAERELKALPPAPPPKVGWWAPGNSRRSRFTVHSSRLAVKEVVIGGYPRSGWMSCEP